MLQFYFSIAPLFHPRFPPSHLPANKNKVNIYLSISISIYLSVYLSIYLSIIYLSIYLSIYMECELSWDMIILRFPLLCLNSPDCLSSSNLGRSFKQVFRGHSGTLFPSHSGPRWGSNMKYFPALNRYYMRPLHLERSSTNILNRRGC